MPVKWDIKIVAIGAALLFVLSLVFLSQVYASLTIAFVLAYLLDPVVTKLGKKGVNRAVAAPVMLIVFFVGLTGLGMVVIPRLFAQGRELMHRLPAVYTGVATALAPWSERLLGYNVFTDVDKLMETVGNPTTLVQPLGGIVGGMFSRTFHFVTALLGLLIIPLMAYYLLRDFPTIYGNFMYLVPKRHHKAMADIRTRLHGVLGGFIRGQLVVSTILSLYYIAAFTSMRLELGLVLGLMAGFFNIVPYLGIVSVLVLTLLIAFIHGAAPATFIGIGAIFAFGMGMEGSFLTPRIVGRKVGLSPLTLIVALLVGGELLGLAGMLLAVPIAAISKVFLGAFITQYRNSDNFKRAS